MLYKFKVQFYIFLGLICIGNGSFAQRREFQESNTTQLVQFEKLMPSKNYDFKSSDLLVKWHLLILDLIEQTPGYTPNVAARTMAYIDLAVYESIVPAFPTRRSFSGILQGYLKPDSLEIDSAVFLAPMAANVCMFKMVDHFFVAAPYVWMERAVALRDSIDHNLRIGSSSYAIGKARKYGHDVAQNVIKYAADDGVQSSLFRSYDLGYRLPACDGCFEINRNADLENTGPLHPYWGQNRLFYIANGAEVDIKPKYSFSKYKDSGYYKEALEVYKVSKDVKPGSEKNSIANFWDDAATYSYTAVGHSVAILTQILRNKSMSLDSSAAFYALLTTSLNDAMVRTWGLKYRYNTMRPGAYIKKFIDSTWDPALLTPPFPEFPSGHSTQSAAMATLLTSFFGENMAYVDFSKFWVGAPRRFGSFWESANETSISRLYGGIHFRDALTQGQELGKFIGSNTLKINLFK